MICMASLLRKLPSGQMIDLLKIDIEGGEQALLAEGDASWLSRVHEIIIEFHPTLVNTKGLLACLKKAGFDYSPPTQQRPMDYFRRCR